MLREKITPDGKAMILLTPLIQSINGFSDSTIQHNLWIKKVKEMPSGNDELKAAWFFGLPYSSNIIDDRYPKLITALNYQTDDCIAFSILIAQSLVAYGERVAARYGEGAPMIIKASFDSILDLLPDMELYAHWTKN